MDDEIAIQTQFALAECYLEAAKSFRKIDENDEAAQYYQTAKQLLSTTMDRFSDRTAHAHALYLLGDLTYEEAGNTKDTKLQKQRYYAALARFSKITAHYSDSLDADKAQFKKAVIYERIGEPESAAEEYVKLAYMYPDSEFLAVGLYRLGAHFRTKAIRAQRELAALNAQIEGKAPKSVDRDMRFRITQMTNEVKERYLKAGRIFGRMVERFPNHELSGRAGLRSAQCYYSAEDYASAIPILTIVSNSESAEGVIRAEALYWGGKCYQNIGDYLGAYSMFVRCTQEYPETQWSGYSLAELNNPRLQDAKKQLQRMSQ
jgi:TolA-binding protein